MNRKDAEKRRFALAVEGAKATLLMDKAAIGEAALALLRSGEVVTIASLIAEIERRMANPEQSKAIRPEEYEAALRRLREDPQAT